MMSDLTIILFTVGLTLLSVGSVMMWQESRYGEGDGLNRVKAAED